MATTDAAAAPPLPAARRATFAEEASRFLRRHPTALVAGLVLVLYVLLALVPQLVTGVDPKQYSPLNRLKPPNPQFWFGTDWLGRDVFARAAWGTRVSLSIGVTTAVLAVAIGLTIGMVAGYLRWLDAIVMRVMDGLMAIPGILLAIAMISLAGASFTTVVVALTIPEIPRVVRLVRSVVLSVREEPYVEAAISVGTPLPKVLWRHVLPNTIPPLIVQATYICASAMLTEAILSFLGAGTPPEIPSWGNMMAEGRTYFQLAPWIIIFPGLALSISVLAVNVLGDGLRDTLDPRIARRMR